MSDKKPKSGETTPIDQLSQVNTTLASLQSDADHIFRLATLGTMTAWLAHEVNNLLTPALGYLQLAQGDPSDDELVARALEKAHSGIESAARISDALLGFSSPRDDEPNRCQLHEVVRASLECLPRDPAKDGVRLTVNVPCDAEVCMRPHALQHVFLNLVLNACSVLRGKRGEITIASVQQANGQTVITVSDSGPGIPKEIAGRIFEPFVTKSSGGRFASNDSLMSGEGSGKSTGLGLAVCRHLIEQAGGTITASSGPGSGATFTITLQAVQATRAKAG